MNGLFQQSVSRVRRAAIFIAASFLFIAAAPEANAGFDAAVDYGVGNGPSSSPPPISMAMRIKTWP